MNMNIAGKREAITSINKVLDRPDIQKAALEKKGIDLTDKNNRASIGVATLAMGHIESGFKNLSTRSDNGNDSNGKFQVGPGAKQAVNKLGLGQGESHTTQDGNAFYALSYYLFSCLGKSGNEKINSSQLQKASSELTQGQANVDGDNPLVEAVRDYNGGPNRGASIGATRNHGQKFINAYKELANNSEVINSFGGSSSNASLNNSQTPRNNLDLNNLNAGTGFQAQPQHVVITIKTG